MAKSRFEYVRNYETSDVLLPNTFLLVRIDGHAFHKFSDAHNFTKPNDPRALDLMDKAALTVMGEMKDVVLAFGESDEYSFLIRRGSTMYNRRESKILTLLLSLFTSSYVLHWPLFFPSPTDALKYPPSFDGRVVVYPGAREVRDYFGWRQADTHVNNLYNTTFWALVQQGGQTNTEAHQTLQGSFSSDKNEILFSRFGINYSTLPARVRKGSIVVRQAAAVEVAATAESEPEPEIPSPAPTTDESTPTSPCQPPPAPEHHRQRKEKKRKPPPPYDGTSGTLVVLHEDLIRDGFWEERPWLLM